MHAPLPRLVLLGALLLVGRAEAAELPGADGKWRQWRSPNFEVYSRIRDADTRELLRSLELLRAAFLDTFKLKERLPLPVTAYLFDTEKLFQAYKPASFRKATSFRGFYQQQPVGPSSSWARATARTSRAR